MKKTKQKTTQSQKSRKTSSKATQHPLPDLLPNPQDAHSPQNEHDQRRAELFTWGDAHACWELNYCRPDGSLGRIRPGLDAWIAFVETASLDDLDLAWKSMDAWRADETHRDSLLQIPVVIPRRGVEDRDLFMMIGKALGYPLVRFRANANGMVYHIQSGREVWRHQCLMATDEWLSWAIWAVMHYGQDNSGPTE